MTPITTSMIGKVRFFFHFVSVTLLENGRYGQGFRRNFLLSLASWFTGTGVTEVKGSLRAVNIQAGISCSTGDFANYLWTEEINSDLVSHIKSVSQLTFLLFESATCRGFFEPFSQIFVHIEGPRGLVERWRSPLVAYYLLTENFFSSWAYISQLSVLRAFLHSILGDQFFLLGL